MSYVPSTVIDPYTQQVVPITLTAAIYRAWLSNVVPPGCTMSVQALYDAAQAGNGNLQQAMALAKAGCTIDMAIMVWGWDPVMTEFLRFQAGWKWVPAANQPNPPLPPFLTFPGMTPYDPNNPPPGSIKVSVSAADFPPATPPVIIPTQPVQVNLVGPQVQGMVPPTYFAGPGAMINSMTPAVTDGNQYTQNGVNYIAHVVEEMMGISVTFTLATPPPATA
jgi:hypothetical protein